MKFIFVYDAGSKLVGVDVISVALRTMEGALDGTWDGVVVVFMVVRMCVCV